MKFTEKGTIHLRVHEFNESGDSETRKLEHSNTRTPKQPNSQKLCFEVEDTGPGIAPDDLDRIFEAFVQTETGQAAEGTGLGLSITHKFIQLMGGEIRVESELGRGATFIFDIQCEIVDSIDNRQSSFINRVIALENGQCAVDGGPYRILTADDKKESRQLLIGLLKPLGFDLREAVNGREALDIWEEWKPHVIWMDIRMPLMDGYEATMRIRNVEFETQKTHDVRTVIIAVTASAFEEEQAIALSVDCDGFLRKPFKETDIFELLQKHLGVRYVYENAEAGSFEKNMASESALSDTEKFTIMSVALAALPPDLLSKLEHAIITVDTKMISTLIEQIRSHNPTLADTLTWLTNNFEYMKILTCLQEITNQKDP
jgi:CheY-like chemotaxis protein